MTDKVCVLGTEYKIILKKYDDEEAVERSSIDGYCDGYTKQIIICDLFTNKAWENEPEETIQAAINSTLRHEIIHAFMNESGLQENFEHPNRYGHDETTIDWFAIQFSKLLAAFKEADCLE